ncbi:hypothetical protein AZA_89313 [Nitrospirillum viridazoti Y2]|uniref:O-antigen ligase-like membrane protein n=1 Tax=Nitrospirillum amazonense TaxID=28077 RepID=A0A560IPW8_9PROT|nr:hypothetical protein [Nitrospirillum amazonense]EGY00643.1 hypothetical protein AZA_89313 [Nitrospirillum amazonense Y2]TWB60481.1 hypothetical protein FBZ92_10642 [Nitrospirillum amazonense]
MTTWTEWAGYGAVPQDTAAQRQPLGVVDWVLLVGFLLGIYTGFAIQITPNVPFPAAISGITGVILLWRRRHRISPAGLAAFLGVTLLLLASILYAPGLDLLSKRTTGLLQMIYSLAISYALFLTVVEAGPAAFCRLMLVFILTIIVGTLLETYAGLAAISDAVRQKIYTSGVYDADIRDELLYGKVRPKLFTSEPSAVTFSYTLFSFCWLLTSTWKYRRFGYLAMMAAAMVAMPGPTLLLMLLLLGLHEMVPKGEEHARTLLSVRLIKIGAVAALALIAFAIIASSVYAARLDNIANGDDESFFYRVIGPFLVTVEVLKNHPILGIGLTGEQMIADSIATVFLRSGAFSPLWSIPDPQEVMTNYFWLHWVYLGICGGVVLMLAITGWLRSLGVHALALCWLGWAILGQASGAYVSPKTWTVLMLIAACSILHAEAHKRKMAPSAPIPAPPPPPRPYPPGTLIAIGGNGRPRYRP